LNKIDADESAEHIKAFRKKFAKEKSKMFEISAVLGEGVPALEEAILDLA
jgi:hypothetical protein